jgi:putative hydrolase of the HAD superfamily
LLWDFDGTLGYRIDGLKGRAWSMSMLEAIREFNPLTGISIEDISPYLIRGFPWHEPEIAHIHLHSPELWWAHIRQIFERIYFELGFSRLQSAELSLYAQRRYVDLSTWELFDDTIPTIDALYNLGWNHVIVSNHVPELRNIIEHLGLGKYILNIVNSAEVGYEKPNPIIYKLAVEKAGRSNNIWMIGDNINADVLGAEQIGIKGILVRQKDIKAKYQFDNLIKLKDFLIAHS